MGVPQYNFNYKVADDVEQTFMALEENRDGEQVTGSYQYVDPLGSLIVVTYTAGPQGYSETREIQEGFVQIRSRPDRKSAVTTSTSFTSGSSNRFSTTSSKSSSSINSADLVAAVLSQVQPLISKTVNSAVSSSSSRFSARPAPVARVPVPAPVPVVAVEPVAVNTGSLTSLFGESGAYNVRLNTPVFNFEY